MMFQAQSLRNRLLIGASLGSMLLAGVAEAQNGRISGGRSAGVDPAAAAARAAQTEALRQGDANAATRRALESFTRAAATRQAMTDAQTAARAAAFAAQSTVPNGLGQGGLQVAEGVTLDPSLWVGANGPKQTIGADGRTLVTVDQTREKAILTWDSFNVGRETDLVFAQDASNWVVLNRVTDVSADPTRILGNIKANGSVFIINRNGVIFGGSSQVNVRNLVASTADISNIQFMERGIHSNVVMPPEFWLPPITLPAFTNAGGDVMVEAGARIQTIAPATVVEGGGYVMLMGKAVENRGTIVTDRGQTILSAGDNFQVRGGYGTLANQASTTRGQEIAITLDAGSTNGRVVNTGVIEAREGDITLAGHTVVQGGVAVSTTSVNTRGTIHLLTDLSDATSSITLTGNSLTLILPELDSKTTATNAQRDALITESLTATGRPSLLNNQGIGRLIYLQPDRKDLSRVEISTGGEAIFEGGSQTIAQGGQIAVVAMKRTTIDSGALLDVSGVQDVMMDMASNNLKINVRPFDMRDSALNREGDGIRSTDVWIDVRDLVLMPSGTGGHVGDRYYTPGGLLEVGGHLGNTAHGIGEWTSVGGVININSNEIIIKDGAVLDISGGSMRYAGGYMQSTRMMGSDGRMYDIGQAPAGVKMLSIGDAFVRSHDRWGDAYTQVYGRPLFSGGRSARWEDGYTVGRDAGVITLSAPTVLMQGQIMADVIVGERQINARPQTSPTLNENGVVNGMPNRLDGYGLPQNVSPLAGGLYIGAGLAQNYSPAAQTVTPFDNKVVIGDAATVAGGVKQNQVLISADTINDAGLGALRIAGGKITVQNDVILANGGQLAFAATEIAVNADLTARSGSISLAAIQPCSSGCSTVTDLSVGEGVRLDTRGLWVNLATGTDRADMAHLDGGAIVLDSRQGDLRLGKGSVVDASAGGAIREDGSFVSANGGDVGLGVGFLVRENANEMVLGGEVRSYGSGDGKGGRLTLSAAGRPITIGESVLGGGDVLHAGQPLPMDLQLSEALVLGAGSEMPFDYNYVVDRVGPGEAFPTDTDFSFDGLELTRDWEVPPGMVIYDNDWMEYYEGDILPAGSSLAFGYGTVPAGYILPADLFPNGVPIAPLSFNYTKGSVLDVELKLPKGFTLAAGTILPVDASVAKPLHLDAGFFQSGFSNYDIRAGGDLQVRGVIDVTAPVRRYTTTSADIASGAAPEDAMELWLPEMFREDAVNGRFIQRRGAGLTLTANGVGPRNWISPFGGVISDPLSTGNVTVSADSVIRVDDGQSVNLNAAQSILMDGRIVARGGSVSMTAGPKENTNRDYAGNVIHYDASRAIWLGENSVVDVSGQARTAIDARGLRYANVSRGGSITIGGETSAYVVVRPGAVLDASGAAAEIDYLSTTLPETRNTLKLATDGGSIAFWSQYGAFLDGDMRAHAGGEGASGGLLSVTLTTPYLPALGSPTRDMPDYMRQLRSIYLDQTHETSLRSDIRFGDCITGCWTPGQTSAEAELSNEGVANFVGQARVGVDQIKKGGFGSLALVSDDVILLNGAIDLNLSRNLTLTGTIANLDGDADARLSAAYVKLAGAGRMLGNEQVFRQTGALALIKRPEIGRGDLTITGGLVDIGSAQFGVNGSIGLSNGRMRDYEYAAPSVVNITSRSDIRMIGGDLNALSNIALTAAQIYPLTNANAGIYAGKFSYRIPGNTSIWNTLMAGGTVSFHKLEGVTPSAPLSLYGSLTVGADIINQGGVLRAPLGSIQLGVGGYSFVPGPEALEPGQTSWSQVAMTTSEINLLNGSLTSVSARDLVIPFGATTDGLTWLLNGVEKAATNLVQGVTVLGSLRADEGSVLDLSGGGTPAGGAFINGRGGSVDILTTALANVNPAFQGLSHADNKVYAIVPDYKGSVTPTALAGHAQPGVGQQIVIPDGVPGLPAGAYMLLPAEFALMEGAFRVELGSSLRAGAGGLNTLADGSVHLGVKTTFAHTTAENALPVEAILTSSKTVRTYSQYNETSFGDFLIAAPAKAQFDNPLSLLPQDGKAFILALTPPRDDSDRPVFSFKGKGLFDAAKGGIGGSLAVIGGNPYSMGNLTLEILGAGGVAAPGALSLYAADLNAVGAKVMTIGGVAQRSLGANINDILVTAGGGLPNGIGFSSGFGGVTMREGAELIAPQVLLITNGEGNILVEKGARISTLGKGDPAFSSAMGYTLRADNINLLSVSNGLLEYTSVAGSSGSGAVTVEDGASIYTDGTLSFVSPGAVRLGENVNYGARYLGFSTGSVNLGATEALAEAAAQGILPGGIALNQTVLDRLMRGDAASGAPRLERLMLSANQSINFYGSISLDTRDAATGKSSLQLVLNTPALYGHGTADDVARITTGTLVWNGLLGNHGTPINPIPTVALPGAVIANGPGTGLGKLDLVAERIVLGYQDGVLIDATLPLNRLALGFSSVNLTASDRIEANHYGDLAVYQSQPVYGQAGQGGVLNLTTPLLTGQAGSRLHYKAGETINVRRPEGLAASTGKVEAALGAEIRLTAGTVLADTTIALPSGKLVMTATTGDIQLLDGARLDLAGRDTKFFDETRYSWGGDVELESTHSSVQQAAGSTIDISADYNHAGLLKVTALQGAVALNGSINGRARNGDKPADPAMRNGSIDVRAGSLNDFATLNRRLTENGVTESRSFVIKTGDLTIGDEVQARHVSISADGGDLTVTGTINASGYRPGSIRLSARDDLTLASTAVLDASGKTLIVDGYGAVIDASNRATVELTSAGGLLTLNSGATLDLSAADGVKRGQVELNARRLGADDVAIDARGPLTIKGANSLSVNGFRTYQPTGGVIDQALMDGVHVDSTAFINAALGNAALLSRMSGLTTYADAFHLRPGVELRSAPGDSLRVSGDLNMAGYRYASLNAATPLTQVYGSGEAGVLLIRAADKLDVYGSITDGFAEPARTPDDNGWVLYPGTQGITTEWVADHQLSAPLKLAEGAQLPMGVSLTFDAPVKGFSVKRNTLIGAEVQLAQSYTLSQDWVATSTIRLPDGSVIAKGAIMTAGTVLPAQCTLGAGAVLPMDVDLMATTWPKGTPLPSVVTLSASTQLQIGDILPRDSKIEIDGPFGLISKPLVLTSPYTLVGDPTLSTASTIPGGANSTAVLTFDVMIRSGTALRRDSGVIPFGFESNSSMSAPTGGWVPTAPIWASKAAFTAGAAPIWTPGQTVTTSLAAGVWFGAGTVLPRQSAGTAGNLSIRATLVPAGTPFNLFNTANVFLNANVVVPAGAVIPVGVNMQPVGGVMQNTRPIQADGTQGRIWAVAPMLERGSQSWSMRLVAGADLGSADSRALRAASEMAPAGQTGNLTLSDRHFFNPQATTESGLPAAQLTALKRMQNFSVIRTGTGSLDLLAGGSYEQLSLYGVYTAGTPSEDIGGLTLDGYNVFNQPRAILAGGANLANPWIGAGFDGYAASIQDYRAWYPENGGDVLLAVQGRMIGYATGRSGGSQRVGSGSVGNWLWRQGGYGVSEGMTPQMGEDMPTAWWINFGGYVPNNSASITTTVNFNAPMLEGFMGVGALGGGNLTVRSGGDAGVVADWSRVGHSTPDSNRAAIASTGLNFAVGGTGRVTSVTRTSGVVTNGTLVQTGGGDINILIGGRLNGGADMLGQDLAGSVVSLRGDINLIAGAVGRMYYSSAQIAIDPRKQDLTSTVMQTPVGGLTVVIGDGAVRLDARGDLVLAGVGDPGSILPSVAGASLGYLNDQGVFVRPDGFMMNSSFSLWHDDTSINLFSAGGNVTPVTLAGGNAKARDGRYWYPPILKVVSASGDIFWDGERCDDYTCNLNPLELAPSPVGQVQFLARRAIAAGGYRTADGQGIHAAGLPIALSGMSNALDLLPNPFRPAFVTGFERTPSFNINTPSPFTGNNPNAIGSLLSFQDDTATGTLLQASKPPALFYAAGGDISNLNVGFVTYIGQNTFYVNSGAAKIRAGRDIVNLGTGPAIGCGLYAGIDCRSVMSIPGVFGAGGLVVHNDQSDITLISAGRDIIYGNMTVAGPGNLVVEAGRNIYQSDKGRFTSVGPLFNLSPSTRNGGAGISVMTGVGAGGPQYDAFNALYLDPANKAEIGRPLADQPGKVVKTYEVELAKWLSDRFGYKSTDSTDALAYFGKLDEGQRAVFARLVYFDELKAGGREYNNTDSSRFGSYLRGRNAIAVLFPDKDAQGHDISYAGDLTMVGGSAIRTLFGGNIEVLVAGGQAIVGVGGAIPPSTAGILSMGSGDIDIYAQGSVLLGQSRVFTTFGGDLFMWSATGDINAGRGSTSTAVYQPPRRVYDNLGNVTLSPPTQNTGAGIATLAPIPEIPAGDIDLIAPLGTIDAGEAGIRVSGDVNLAALQVLNAANIEVKGSAVGIPVVAAVNTSALTAASNATSTVAAEATRLAERARPITRDMPAIITSRFLGFGEG
ncbi:filamentous haemagglutinin family protein [Brevundimonas nasdae]|uniref:Filamentous hemagglutinin family protein n=1 Tax=Brevundimonas nasdae TaxID=172043 RepID=A0ABX8THK9_9CAUL|nr:filamentous haemagglutinin family protein [Brevundimonas nasdae]QYC10700.1 filamentous hemagglutinin family protein [Brevundimonas nasdae]QYC13487.1 filamentous hemagglutinin family protein [Brevundimonas nasdae]